jgi:hypothetical protein
MPNSKPGHEQIPLEVLTNIETVDGDYKRQKLDTGAPDTRYRSPVCCYG